MRALRSIHRKLLTIFFCAYFVVIFAFFTFLNMGESSPRSLIRALPSTDKSDLKAPHFIPDANNGNRTNRTTSKTHRSLPTSNESGVGVESPKHSVESTARDTEPQHLHIRPNEQQQDHHTQRQQGQQLSLNLNMQEMELDTPHGDPVVHAHHTSSEFGNDSSDVNALLFKLEEVFPGLKNLQPDPVMEPYEEPGKKSQKTHGDFTSIGRGAYVFSAYLDDRKAEEEGVFVRLMVLLSQRAATASLYYHANGDNPYTAVKCHHYEMCENHNKFFGGYILSCPFHSLYSTTHSSLTFPSTKNGSSESFSASSITVSLGKFAPQFKIPVFRIRPHPSKIPFLNTTTSLQNVLLHSNQARKLGDLQNALPPDENKLQNSPLLQQPQHNLSLNVQSISYRRLSFAVCVSPLFGTITAPKLVEFIELSTLLGAEHFYVYNFSVSPTVSRTLEYYKALGIMTVVPFSLPAEIKNFNVWYHGQLLANNDCLYRSMPHHDLVAFNDVDEYIVPHGNGAMTWHEAFSGMLSSDWCGLSFQSAFFELRPLPQQKVLQRQNGNKNGIYQQNDGDTDGNDIHLVTSITSRTSRFHKIRTKVIAFPWRVFEVGIHHISKQNQQEWQTHFVDPSLAFLHHYRRCTTERGSRCDLWDADTTVPDRYHKQLIPRFKRVMKSIARSQG